VNLIAAYFEERPEYRDLKTIFINSARSVMPDCKIHIIEADKINRDNLDHHLDTVIGFKLAAEAAIELNEPAAICDIDLMFRKSIEDVWHNNFDIAVTIRNHPARYNTGIWFYRPTMKAKTFVRHWIELTELFAAGIEGIKPGLDKYAGIDQYALACVKKKRTLTNVIELQCQEWNAEQTCWPIIDERTKVIHLKSQLRNVLFGRDQRTKYDGTISKNLKVFPACIELAKEARGWL